MIKRVPVSTVVAVEDTLRRTLVSTAIIVNTVGPVSAGHWCSFVTNVSLIALPKMMYNISTVHNCTKYTKYYLEQTP